MGLSQLRATLGEISSSITSSKFHGDGKPDLWVANECADFNCATGTVGVLVKNGDGSFQPAVTHGSGGYQAQSIAVADVNGDFKPDLLVANFNIDLFNLGTGAVDLLLNNTGSDSTPPAITLFAAAKVFESPKKKILQIKVSGTIIDTVCGVSVAHFLR